MSKEEKLLKLLTKNFKLLNDVKYSYNTDIWSRANKQYFYFVKDKEHLLRAGVNSEEVLLKLKELQYTPHFYFKELGQFNKPDYVNNVIFQTGKPVKNSLKTAWSFAEYSYDEDISYACSINVDRILDVSEPIISNPSAQSILPFAISLVLQTSLINPPNIPCYMLDMVIPFSEHLILDHFHLYSMYYDLDSLLLHDLKKGNYEPETQDMIRYQFGKIISDLVSNSNNWKEIHTIEDSTDLFTKDLTLNIGKCFSSWYKCYTNI
jgi:hypothetical protein